MFFTNCSHLSTRTQEKKGEDVFLVKIANEGTTLRQDIQVLVIVSVIIVSVELSDYCNLSVCLVSCQPIFKLKISEVRPTDNKVEIKSKGRNFSAINQSNSFSEEMWVREGGGWLPQ